MNPVNAAKVWPKEDVDTFHEKFSGVERMGVSKDKCMTYIQREHLPHRTIEDCWQYYLDGRYDEYLGSIGRVHSEPTPYREWTGEEKDGLRRGVAKYGANAQKHYGPSSKATTGSNGTADSSSTRWWTEEKEQNLLRLVKEQEKKGPGTNKWKAIASRLNALYPGSNRSASACSTRYSIIKPYIDGASLDADTHEQENAGYQWSDLEVETLTRAVKKHGNDWVHIAANYFGGRRNETACMMKYRRVTLALAAKKRQANTDNGEDRGNSSKKKKQKMQSTVTSQKKNKTQTSPPSTQPQARAVDHPPALVSLPAAAANAASASAVTSQSTSSTAVAGVGAASRENHLQPNSAIRNVLTQFKVVCGNKECSVTSKDFNEIFSIVCQKAVRRVVPPEGKALKFCTEEGMEFTIEEIELDNITVSDIVSSSNMEKKGPIPIKIMIED